MRACRVEEGNLGRWGMIGEKARMADLVAMRAVNAQENSAGAI